MRIKDSVVVITGASSGIGRATALRFAAKGARLVLAARGSEALDMSSGGWTCGQQRRSVGVRAVHRDPAR